MGPCLCGPLLPIMCVCLFCLVHFCMSLGSSFFFFNSFVTKKRIYILDFIIYIFLFYVLFSLLFLPLFLLTKYILYIVCWCCLFASNLSFYCINCIVLLITVLETHATKVRNFKTPKLRSTIYLK